VSNSGLCENPNPKAIYILKNNQNKINSFELVKNPNIFVDEYKEACQEHFRKDVTEELIAKAFHPKNLSKLSSWGYEEFDDMDFSQ